MASFPQHSISKTLQATFRFTIKLQSLQQIRISINKHVTTRGGAFKPKEALANLTGSCRPLDKFNLKVILWRGSKIDNNLLGASNCLNTEAYSSFNFMPLGCQVYSNLA